MKHRTEGHTETTISGDTRADWSEALDLVPSLQIAYVWHRVAPLVQNIAHCPVKLVFGCDIHPASCARSSTTHASGLKTVARFYLPATKVLA